jgi:predicted nucleic acid-binding Zn ribbon protein
MRGVEPIGRILKEVIEDLGVGPRMAEQRAVIEWPDVVGPKVASHCRAIRIEQGRMLVEVGSPVWAQELSLMRRTIIQKINRRLGSRTVQSLHFVVGGKGSHDPSGSNGPEDGHHGR